MNKLSFRLSAISAVILGLSTFSASAVGQTDRPALIVPCRENDGPGRPTLKRRQADADEKPSPANVVDGGDKAQPCDPVRKETDWDSNQKSAKVYFECLKSLSESDVLHFLRENGVDLPKNPALEPNLVEKDEETIKQFLFARGYVHAAVSARIDNLDNNQPALTFVVSEGRRLKIAEIRFEGNKVFSSQLLGEKMKEYLTSFEESERDLYDAEILDYCLHRLNNFVRSQGYLQGSFRDPKIEESNGGLIITLRTYEGPLYRLGKLKVEGSSLLPPERIAAMFGQETGDIVDSERLSKFLYEELKTYYGDRGYIQYTAEVTPEFNSKPGGSEGVVDVEITIDEGGQFKVSAIDFEGVNLPTEELRQLLLLKNGDIYDQKLFEETIRKLNDTGLFEEIDKDKDANFRTNDEGGLVHIVIKLTRKKADDRVVSIRI